MTGRYYEQVGGLRSVSRRAGDDGTTAVTLHTDAGDVACRYHPAAEGAAGVVWVFGSGGGLGGPAGGLYERLGRALVPEGVASLELDYRRPGVLEPCVRDVLAGLTFLENEGRERLVLVGHSFGGAVVIRAALAHPDVAAVAALSSQTAGTERVGKLRGRSLLVLHGEADEVLPDACSRGIFERAGEPKKLLLYPNCGHGLDACRDAVDRDLAAWLRTVIHPPRR